MCVCVCLCVCVCVCTEGPLCPQLRLCSLEPVFSSLVSLTILVSQLKESTVLTTRSQEMVRTAGLSDHPRRERRARAKRP